RRKRREAHRNGGELPEVGHQPRVGIRAQAGPGHYFLAEVVELVLAEAALQEGTGVDARRGVTLEEDLVAPAVRVLAAEEVVEADFVERGRAGVGGEMATDA